MSRSSSQARLGNRRVWDLTAQARERHLGALSCEENPAAGKIPQASGGWGSRLSGLPTAASRSEDLTPYPTQEAGLSPRHWHTYGVPTARAHKRQPTQEEGPGPLCPRLVRLYLMIHLALLFV